MGVRVCKCVCVVCWGWSEEEQAAWVDVWWAGAWPWRARLGRLRACALCARPAFLGGPLSLALTLVRACVCVVVGAGGGHAGGAQEPVCHPAKGL